MTAPKVTLTACLSLLILTAPFLLPAQSIPADPPDIERTNEFNLRLQHTTLVVSDYDVSREFYTEVLKLKDLNADWLPERQMFLSLGNNLELHVGEVKGVEIKPSDFNHFAISTNDLEGFLIYLKEKGIVYSSLGGAEKYAISKRPDGVRQTFIRDPDGYWIEINDANTALRKNTKQ